MNATRAVELASPARDDSPAIGAILVENGKLTANDVPEILRFARDKKLLFGEAAIRLKRVKAQDVAIALGRQFRYPILARGEGGVADEVVAVHSPQRQAVEALRGLRSTIRLGWMQAAERRNVLAITSPSRREGRSWLCANLGAVFAQGGDRTLIIDADMRRPSQHRLFNVDNSAGLSGLLAGKTGRESIQRVHAQLPLYVLAAGVIPPNPQELLGRAAFDAVMSQFAQQFDLVLLDTPPATESADAQLLASRAGAALLLAHRHHTRHASLAAATSAFKQTGVNIIGGIVVEH